MNSATTNILTGLFFNIKGVWLVLLWLCFIEILRFNASCREIRHRVPLRLIWVNPVCQCPFYEVRGMNGLRDHNTLSLQEETNLYILFELI